MKPENLTEFSEEQLVQEYKKIKTNKIINAVIIGIPIGIFFYNSARNGFGFFTFFPLIIAYLLFTNSANSKLLEKAIMQEMKSRNLN